MKTNLFLLARAASQTSPPPQSSLMHQCLRRSISASWILPLLLTLPAAVEAQFTFTTNIDGTLNIAKYTGSGGAVTIPSTTNGLPVTSIGLYAFAVNNSLTNVTIPNSITNIG